MGVKLVSPWTGRMATADSEASALEFMKLGYRRAEDDPAAGQGDEVETDSTEGETDMTRVANKTADLRLTVALWGWAEEVGEIFAEASKPIHGPDDPRWSNVEQYGRSRYGSDEHEMAAEDLGLLNAFYHTDYPPFPGPPSWADTVKLDLDYGVGIVQVTFESRDYMPDTVPGTVMVYLQMRVCHTPRDDGDEILHLGYVDHGDIKIDVQADVSDLSIGAAADFAQAIHEAVAAATDAYEEATK